MCSLDTYLKLRIATLFKIIIGIGISSVLMGANVSATADDGQTIKFSDVDSLVDEAVELFYQKKFDEAMAMCDQVIREHPENPLGYLGQAGIYHLIMMNYRINLFDHQFDSLTTLAIKKGENAVSRFKKDANAYFVLGGAYGFRGLNRLRRGEWLSAFYDGLKGITYILKAHRLDKELYDVYYALGLFYYWKSVKAKILTSIKLMKDERERGIKYIKISIENGRLSSSEGKFALVEIYYYEDRYQEALAECASLAEKFQNDPTWNYLMAKIHGKLNQWSAAMPYYQKLLELLESSPYKSNSYLAECHYGIAKCAFETNDSTTAVNQLQLALEYSKKWDNQQEIEGPLLDFDKVLERMETLKIQLNFISGQQ